MSKYITKQRKALQNYLEQHIDEELSAKIVAEALAGQGISLSAVYRNLADLEREKLVVQCHKEGSREFFFRYIAAHDCKLCFHLSCKICGHTQHLSHVESDFLQHRVLSAANFTIDKPKTIFYGVCQACNAGL